MENDMNMIKIGTDYYEELLEAKMQRDLLLNIIKNVRSYDVAEYVKAVWGVEPVKEG